jgi:hypothetical protein
MKQALISTVEPRANGYRVAQVDEAAFPVADTLFWVECSDDIVADQYYYDPSDQTIKVLEAQLPDGQIPTTGTQTL